MLRNVCLAVFLAVAAAGTSDAAIVGFLGNVTSGRSGPVLGSLPRNFTLVLDYTPTPGGTTGINSGTLTFPATPNSNTSNTNVLSTVSVPLTVPFGGIAIGNNSGPMGQDFLTFTGRVNAGLLGPNNVNFAFTFLKPGDTIASEDLNPTSIASLISGQTTIAFSGGTGGFSATGTVRGAPEPVATFALTALVAGGCGVGLRRRLKKKVSEAAN